MRLYLIALQFLTIIPVPFRLRIEEKDLGRSMAVFPMVGLTLGALLAAADFIMAHWLPRPVVDLLLVAILSGLTGALHLDGLADVCDALAARGNRERFLEVMKDSRIGAVGVVGLVLGLMLKYQALVHIPLQYKLNALLFFPMAGRFSQVLMTVGARKARRDGLGSSFIDGAGKWQLATASLLTISIAWILFGVRGLCAMGPVVVFTWGLKASFNRRLGGISGDIIGFASELNEIICLLLLLGLFGAG